jgi:hypothetical protein
MLLVGIMTNSWLLFNCKGNLFEGDIAGVDEDVCVFYFM